MYLSVLESFEVSIGLFTESFEVTAGQFFMLTIFKDIKRFFLKAIKFIRNNYNNPVAIFAKILSLRPIRYIVPDRFYLIYEFEAYTGSPLNLENPQTFNEKQQWLKLYDRKDWYTTLVDKLEVRKYITEHIGEQYLIPLIKVYNSPDEINLDELPNKFVLKCTHDSGTVIICRDKAELDLPKIKKALRKKLGLNYYYEHREYPYKNIIPKIVCEEFISEDGETPIDYKFWCFNGAPEIIQVDTKRFTDHGRLTLDIQWNKLPFQINRLYIKEGLHIDKPNNLEEMLEISRKLSKGFKFIRVDLYSVNNKIYFGELTFYQLSGYEDIYPPEYNYKLGQLIDLNN